MSVCRLAITEIKIGDVIADINVYVVKSPAHGMESGSFKVSWVLPEKREKLDSTATATTRIATVGAVRSRRIL